MTATQKILLNVFICFPILDFLLSTNLQLMKLN